MNQALEYLDNSKINNGTMLQFTSNGKIRHNLILLQN